MKNRHGFVANSSSSSYLIITSGEEVKRKHLPEDAFREGELLIPSEFGELSWGWNPKEHKGFLDKVNFAFLQIMYRDEEYRFDYEFKLPMIEGTESANWFNMLNEALASRGYKPKYVIQKYEAEQLNTFAYAMSPEYCIDHMSSAIENKNIEMFDSQRDLEEFLFSEDSSIVVTGDGYES